ncbi:MAG: transporter substrate-binding domain-containing protein [Clostridia bacterium]|nr:transporter substrate-binding domain-containing protein [Clostridia bacterium]
MFGTVFLFKYIKFNNNVDNSQKLRVGMECSYAPFNWIQPNSDNYSVKISDGWYANGYDIYISKIIAEKLNKKLEIVKIDWDGLLPALTSGKIDLIVAGMSATEERKKSIDFTDNYYRSNIVIVTKKSSTYENSKKIQDFGGARITGQMGTVHYDLINQINNVIKCTPVEDFSSMVSALNAGKIDGFVCEKPAALILTHSNPNLILINFEENSGFEISQDNISIAIGVQKNNNLKEQVNKILEQITEEQRSELMNLAVERSYISK